MYALSNGPSRFCGEYFLRLLSFAFDTSPGPDPDSLGLCHPRCHLSTPVASAKTSKTSSLSGLMSIALAHWNAPVWFESSEKESSILNPGLSIHETMSVSCPAVTNHHKFGGLRAFLVIEKVIWNSGGRLDITQPLVARTVFLRAISLWRWTSFKECLYVEKLFSHQQQMISLSSMRVRKVVVWSRVTPTKHFINPNDNRIFLWQFYPNVLTISGSGSFLWAENGVCGTEEVWKITHSHTEKICNAQSQKYLPLSDPLWKKFANSCYRA